MDNSKLLGNRIESALKTIGADKVAKFYEKVGRKPCGCAGRREALNKWHLKAIQVLENLQNEGKDGETK